LYLQRCPLVRGETLAKAGRCSGRVATLDAMGTRAEALLDRVPVTRVSDISRLEQSALPVFSATTPLARDLTTHMGKGLTRQAARLSAVMEAVERISAETPPATVIRAAHRQLLTRDKNCIDPERFDLPPTTAYHPDLELDWIAGWDLIGQAEILVPADLCISPPQQGVLDQVDTNGLASGASFGEAIRHALLEIIERDATGQQLFFELFGSDGQPGPNRYRIDIETLSAACMDTMQKITSDRLRIVLEDITSDIAIPVVACYLIDDAYPADSGPQQAVFGGWGCDPVTAHAVDRALTEAHQSRIGTIQAARDSFNVVQGGDRPFSRRSRISVLEDAPARPMPAHYAGSDDIGSDVDHIIEKLRDVGVDQVIVADLSAAHLGIPVVRVRVPGLSSFMVDRQRIGWRCMRHIL
jgi:YcaO-like protein with predicted kinase domain